MQTPLGVISGDKIHSALPGIGEGDTQKKFYAWFSGGEGEGTEFLLYVLLLNCLQLKIILDV